MVAQNKTVLVLVEPQRLWRTGLERILKDAHDLDLTGSFGSVAELTTFLDDPDRQPQLILLSAAAAFSSAPDQHDPILLLKKRYPTVSVAVMSATDSDTEIFRAMKTGANAYIPADQDEEQLINCVRDVAAGRFTIDQYLLQRPNVARQVMSHFRETAEASLPDNPLFAPLSKREKQILELIAQGQSNKEVARTLQISDQTVKNHMSSIMRKLNVNDRTQAVVFALRNGWIKL